MLPNDKHQKDHHSLKAWAYVWFEPIAHLTEWLLQFPIDTWVEEIHTLSRTYLAFVGAIPFG